MSNFLHQTGYIYPLPQMTDEERFEYLGKVNEEATFDLDADKFMTEQLGDNNYLLWVTSSSYGKESGEFGKCRPCNQKEIYYHAPKFREILGEIDTAKLKYIDYCYYNSTECTVDYYLSEKEYKPMTLDEAIAHAKEVADSKCDKCSKEHAQLAEWLQELQGYKDETPITRDYLKSVCNNLKTNDYIKLSFGEYDEDDFYISIKYIIDVHEMCIEYDPVMQWKCPVHTVGQLRMFMTICGLENFVNN